MLKKIVITGFLISSFASVYAMTPSLNISATAANDAIVLNVTGDPNSDVVFSYTSTNSSGVQNQTVGMTNSSGFFGTTLGKSLYNFAPNSSVFVTVNNQQSSPSVVLSVLGSNSSGVLTLNQSGLVLSLGQVSVITSSNATSLYVLSNTNSSAANVVASGNQVTVTAANVGSTLFTVCASGSSSCVNAYAVVQNNGAQVLTFSQNTITLTTGQTLPVSVYGGTGVYSIVNNSNTGILSANINGQMLNLQANNSIGQSSVVICSNDMNSCGVIHVNVAASIAAQPAVTQVTGLPIFNPIIEVGSKAAFALTGANGSYSVSSPQSTFFQTNISGSLLTITGLAVGSGQMSVCSSSSSCSSFVVTISGQIVPVAVPVVSVPVSQVTTPSTRYVFNNPISFGAKGEEVVELQKRLHEKGFFNGKYVANYGDGTVSAVKKFQKAHGLAQLGNLGPATRALLNK